MTKKKQRNNETKNRVSLTGQRNITRKFESHNEPNTSFSSSLSNETSFTVNSNRSATSKIGCSSFENAIAPNETDESFSERKRKQKDVFLKSKLPRGKPAPRANVARAERLRSSSSSIELTVDASGGLVAVGRVDLASIGRDRSAGSVPLRCFAIRTALLSDVGVVAARCLFDISSLSFDCCCCCCCGVGDEGASTVDVDDEETTFDVAVLDVVALLVETSAALTDDPPKSMNLQFDRKMMSK